MVIFITTLIRSKIFGLSMQTLQRGRLVRATALGEGQNKKRTKTHFQAVADIVESLRSRAWHF